MWRSRTPKPPADDREGPAGAAATGTGAFQSLDQLANWVRFADTKATILAASLGVVLTMVMSKGETIANAISSAPCRTSVIVSALAAGTTLGVGWTLFWLLRAIGPQTKTRHVGLNRFSWPSLVGATPSQLAEHAMAVDAGTDAWWQVVELANIADRKFRACGRAVQGFGFVVVCGVACVVVATVVTT